MKAARGNWIDGQDDIDPERLIFIDESGLANAGATHYTNGIVETPGLLSFVVPAAAPATLFYQCDVHNPMSGTLLIVDPPPAVPALGTAAVVGLAVLVLAAGYLVRRRRGRGAV